MTKKFITCIGKLQIICSLWTAWFQFWLNMKILILKKFKKEVSEVGFRLDTAATPNLCSTQLGLDSHKAAV